MRPRADIVQLSQRLGLGSGALEEGDYERLMSTMFATIDRFQSLPSPGPRIARTTRREALGRPAPGEDPLNAIAQRCLVEGAAHGVLSGVRTTVKDLIPIASVPMSAGTEAFADYGANRRCGAHPTTLGRRRNHCRNHKHGRYGVLSRR